MLISKLRRIRNILEHEYKFPSINEVLEAIEVASLFLRATNIIFYAFTNEFLIGDREDLVDTEGRFQRCIHIQYNHETHIFNLHAYDQNNDLDPLS